METPTRPYRFECRLCGIEGDDETQFTFMLTAVECDDCGTIRKLLNEYGYQDLLWIITKLKEENSHA